MENSNPNGSNENSQHSDDTGKESLPADTPVRHNNIDHSMNFKINLQLTRFLTFQI